VTAFSEQLSEFREILTVGSALIIEASGKIDNEAIRLTVHNFMELEECIGDIPSKYKILIKEASAIPGLQSILQDATKGKCQVNLALPFENKTAIIKFPRPINLTPEMKEQLWALPAVEVMEEAS